MPEIRVLCGHAESEIIEKKSRFIANVFEIHSEEEALKELEGIRKKYYDARHHCYAYVLGERNEIQRFSDDKEPQGTAGKPILEVLTKQGFHNSLIVVTRYFGGILLGTGGLTRAYSGAAAEGLAEALRQGISSSVFHGQACSIACDYSLSGKIQYLLAQENLSISDTIYDAAVTFQLVLPLTESERICKKLTEASNAAARITLMEPSVYRLDQGIAVPYTF